MDEQQLVYMITEDNNRSSCNGSVVAIYKDFATIPQRFHCNVSYKITKFYLNESEGDRDNRIRDERRRDLDEYTEILLNADRKKYLELHARFGGEAK